MWDGAKVHTVTCFKNEEKGVQLMSKMEGPEKASSEMKDEQRKKFHSQSFFKKISGLDQRNARDK